MSDQRLRLQAEVRDNASPKLRQIGKELKEIRRTPGMEQADKQLREFTTAAKEAVSGSNGLGGVLGAVGVGGLTAATSIAALATQLKQLGDHVFAMKRLGQETGLTVDQIRRWEFVGQVFRVTNDQVDAALKTFGDKMVDFKRHRGELFGSLNQLDPGESSKLLGMKDADAQFKEILRWLSTIKDASVRNRWAKEFFGSDDLDSLLTNGLPALEKAMAKAKQQEKPISPEMEAQADKLAESIASLNQAWQNFELKIGPGFLAMLSKIVDASRFALGGATDEEKKQLDQNAEERRKGFEAKQKELKDDAATHQRQGGAADERQDSSHDADYLRKKTAYGGSSHLLHNAAYVTGGDAGGSAASGPYGLAGIIAAGTEQGVLSAFRQLMAQQSVDAAGDGIIKAAYGPGGDGAGRGGRYGLGGRGGASGLGGGNAIPHGSYGSPSSSLLDFIAKSEGAKGYDTSLGNGRFLPGHHETNLQGMSLKQVLDLGRYMRHQPGNPNSSALGRYQMTGETIRDLMGRMHLSGDEKFDAKMQDSMASKLIQDEGPRALQRWASLRGNRMGTALGLLKSGNIASMPGDGAASDVGLHLHALNEQCVSLAKAAVGATGSVREWHRGVGALAGTLKPGTPVATFLDAFGRKVDRYANGGIGTMGAHRDHAGVFQSYIRDKSGQITGMNIAEQYKGSHGVHSRAYAFGQGWGEKNASNYAAILGADGEPLGGHRNPMSLVEEARRADGDRHRVEGGIEAHVHIHDGQVRGATARSSGAVEPPRVHLRRGPTMTEATMTSA